MAGFIGLDGGQGSGKTTYATTLVSQLGKQTGARVLYIETDDFLVERASRESLSESFFLDSSNRRKLWDFERMGSVLQEFKYSGGETINIDGLYNTATGKRDRTEQYKVTASAMVVVGGPYLLEPEFEGLFEHMIFLDVPEDIRRKRVLARNKLRGRSGADAEALFQKFEHFYKPYWSGQLKRYAEIVYND